MTREEAIEITWEEAIEILEQMKSTFQKDEWMKKDIMALEMAIRAMKTKPCKDVISRQAAIYVISHAQVNFDVESEIDFTKYKREVHEIVAGVLNAQEKALKDLPPVQPAEIDSLKEFWEMMDDVIDKMEEKENG